MAKKPRRGRSMGKYIRGPIDETLALGTLAAADLISDDWDNLVGDTTLVSSVVCAWSLGNITAPQGPILFGIAHGDYTDAEIEAWVEQVNGWNIGGLIEQEVSRRKIRMIGTFITGGVSAGTTDALPINDGKPVKTKLNWILITGQTLRIWAFNSGSNPIATTVPSLTVNGHVNLFPQ